MVLNIIVVKEFMKGCLFNMFSIESVAACDTDGHGRGRRAGRQSGRGGGRVGRAG